MMGGLFTWLIIGVVLYLLLSRRGGMGGMMGCCGGHDHHPHEHSHNPQPHEAHSEASREDIVDLKKEDYHVVTR